MSETENKELVRRIYEAMWNEKDPALAASVAAEIFAQPEGVQRFLREFKSAFPDLRHTVITLIAEGDRVAAQFTATGTHTGAWKGHAPTGRPVTYTGVTIARIADGKIVEHHTWWDTWELIEQIKGS